MPGPIYWKTAIEYLKSKDWEFVSNYDNCTLKGFMMLYNDLKALRGHYCEILSIIIISEESLNSGKLSGFFFYKIKEKEG